jgi:hypothetical protein
VERMPVAGRTVQRAHGSRDRRWAMPPRSWAETMACSRSVETPQPSVPNTSAVRPRGHRRRRVPRPDKPDPWAERRCWCAGPLQGAGWRQPRTSARLRPAQPRPDDRASLSSSVTWRRPCPLVPQPEPSLEPVGAAGAQRSVERLQGNRKLAASPPHGRAQRPRLIPPLGFTHHGRR